MPFLILAAEVEPIDEPSSSNYSATALARLAIKVDPIDESLTRTGLAAATADLRGIRHW